MATFLDSERVFAARVKFFKLDGLKAEFEKNNWNTLGNFAFSINFSPGQSISEEAFAENIFKPLLGDAADTSPLKVVIRRLYYEAYAAAAADMARRSNPEPPLTKVTTLPMEEKTFRLNALKARLGPGIKIKAELEPAECVIDKFSAMREAGIIRWMPWEALIRWDQEIKDEKKDPYWKPNAAGQMVLFNPENSQTAEVGNDLLKLQNAMTRRAIAMDVAGLLTYETHDECLTQWYMREIQREPILQEFRKINMNQLRRVDMEIFVGMAELTREGLGLDASGNPVLDGVLRQLVNQPRVQQLLLQPAASVGSGGGGQSRVDKGQDSSKRQSQEVQALREKVRKLEAQTKGNFNSKGGAKGSGKSHKEKRNFGNMPNELRGMLKAVNGIPICFGYNCKSGCSNNTDSKRMCFKGKHVCARPGCGGDHPAYSDLCPKKE